MKKMLPNNGRPAVAWGASRIDWLHWGYMVGVVDDLVPIQDRPGLRISQLSRLKDTTKAPALLNAAGEVIGMTGWTRHFTTPDEFDSWASSGYGIGVHARALRALDGDIDDPLAAARVVCRVQDWCAAHGLPPMPVRHRRGSARFLLIFWLVDIWLRKLVLRSVDGAVELLGNGQQYVVAGRHQSGARYEWEGGLPVAIPTLTPALLAELLVEVAAEMDAAVDDVAALRQRIESGGGGGVIGLPRRSADAVDDPIVDFLYERGLVLGEDGQGRLYVRCPWDGEHTQDTSMTATTWLCAGTGGHREGRWKCLHAHCAGRGTTEFLDAIGYTVEMFNVVPSSTARERPGLLRSKSGIAAASLTNVVTALTGGYVEFDFGYDEFRREAVLSPAGRNEWRPIQNSDFIELRLLLAQPPARFAPVGRELISDAVEAACYQHRFDAAREWLMRLRGTWDGVPRVERLFHTYFGAEDNDYTRAIGLYHATAMAARVMQPGCQVDVVVILVAPQGTLKTSGVKALAPAPEHFVEVSFDMRDDDLSRKLKGKLVAELSELRGLARADLERIKAVVTRTHEEWIPKYREKPELYPRYCVWIGTTNAEDFLADSTGERRWAPLRAAVLHPVDVAALKRDMAQLWAERLALYEQHGGVVWQPLTELMPEAHAEHRIADPWEELVANWLEGVDADGSVRSTRNDLRASDVLTGLGLKPQNITKREEMRVGVVLRMLGYERKLVWKDGVRTRVWVRKVAVGV